MDSIKRIVAVCLIVVMLELVHAQSPGSTTTTTMSTTTVTTTTTFATVDYSAKKWQTEIQHLYGFVPELTQNELSLKKLGLIYFSKEKNLLVRKESKIIYLKFNVHFDFEEILQSIKKYDPVQKGMLGERIFEAQPDVTEIKRAKMDCNSWIELTRTAATIFQAIKRGLGTKRFDIPLSQNDTEDKVIQISSPDPFGIISKGALETLKIHEEVLEKEFDSLAEDEKTSLNQELLEFCEESKKDWNKLNEEVWKVLQHLNLLSRKIFPAEFNQNIVTTLSLRYQKMRIGEIRPLECEFFSQEVFCEAEVYSYENYGQLREAIPVPFVSNFAIFAVRLDLTQAYYDLDNDRIMDGTNCRIEGKDLLCPYEPILAKSPCLQSIQNGPLETVKIKCIFSQVESSQAPFIFNEANVKIIAPLSRRHLELELSAKKVYVIKGPIAIYSKKPFEIRWGKTFQYSLQMKGHSSNPLNLLVRLKYDSYELDQLTLATAPIEEHLIKRSNVNPRIARSHLRFIRDSYNMSGYATQEFIKSHWKNTASNELNKIQATMDKKLENLQASINPYLASAPEDTEQSEMTTNGPEMTPVTQSQQEKDPLVSANDFGEPCESRYELVPLMKDSGNPDAKVWLLKDLPEPAIKEIHTVLTNYGLQAINNLKISRIEFADQQGSLRPLPILLKIKNFKPEKIENATTIYHLKIGKDIIPVGEEEEVFCPNSWFKKWSDYDSETILRYISLGTDLLSIIMSFFMTAMLFWQAKNKFEEVKGQQTKAQQKILELQLSQQKLNDLISKRKRQNLVNRSNLASAPPRYREEIPLLSAESDPLREGQLRQDQRRRVDEVTKGQTLPRK